MDGHFLTVRQAIAEIASGELHVGKLLSAFLENIDRLEGRVGAWAYFNRETVLEQAEKVERLIPSRNGISAPLMGIPIGVKDIFDTADMPTENGTEAQKGRQPQQDALAVKLLRDSGALIMGKTVTAELAVYTPGKTTNPHDPARTPGGSSSGSAAAVAAGMVPLAIGTQTNGSVIRPASYCGVVGYKPTFGSIPREGILKQAHSLDQVGIFSTNVRDAALLARVLTAGSNTDNNVQGSGEKQETPPYQQETKQISQPKFAFIKSPAWGEATDRTQQECLNFIQRMGDNVVEVDLPQLCDYGVKCHRTIMLYEMAHNYERFYEDHYELLSKTLLDMLIEGKNISLEAYLDAKEMARDITDVIDDLLGSFDGVLTPATPSEAPTGLDSTGSPIFCTIWSLCGVPAISLPVLRGEEQMPLGLQIVAARGMDGRLIESADWIERFYHQLQID
jgi:Asp-tRNA(Asn)/Glu-tRNA(Gln) amidotransferase A subunit family amidase